MSVTAFNRRRREIEKENKLKKENEKETKKKAPKKG
jgi:hypothetical protein